jgi:mono/diheme cytochrome c family protein
MSPESTQRTPTTPETAEPGTGQRVLPIWLILLLFILLYWGMVYFDLHGAWFSQEVYAPYRSLAELQTWQPAAGGEDLYALGRIVYNKPSCVTCHQADANGTPGQFPPLVQSDWLKEPEPGRVIRLVLNGLNGPINVKGHDFNSSMVPWKDVLSDKEIAAVLTYVRQNKDWGNNAPPVKPERVKAVHEKLKDRSQPFTADELLKISPAE